MVQKFVHKVSSELTDDAQYKNISDIAAADLTRGTTVQVYPGTYDVGLLAAIDDISFVGVGDVDDVILNNVSLSNTCANTVMFENILIQGSNVAVTSLSAAIEVGHAADNSGPVTLKLKRTKLSNAEFGVKFHGNTGSLVAEFIDARSVDRSFISNCNIDVMFSRLNSSGNAYFTSGGSGTPAVTVIASQSGGSNTGATTETVKALIS